LVTAPIDACEIAMDIRRLSDHIDRIRFGGKA
jgi:hypothetical protein